MKKIHFLLSLLALGSLAQAQNVGIGETAPANKLSVKGSLSIGSAYSTTAAPANGAIIQGNVGIGTASPNNLFTVGGSNQFQVNTAGAIVAATGITSSGTIIFSSMSAAGVVHNNASGQLSTSLVSLSSDISGILPVSNGGTGGASLTGFVYGNGASPMTASTTIPGSAITGNISGNAANITGTVAVANGGTGATSFTGNGVLFGNGTGAIQATGASTGAGQILYTATAGGAPSWTSASGLFIQNGTSQQASSNFNISGTGVIGGNATVMGGTLALNNGTSNMISYSATGVAAPTFTTSSSGTKIIFYPQETATSVDYAAGITGSTLWHAVPQANSTFQHTFYGGTTELMRIRGDGNVGIGTTSPSDKLDVLASGGTDVLLGGGATTHSEIKLTYAGVAHYSMYNNGSLTFANTSSTSVTNTAGTSLMAISAAGIVDIPALSGTNPRVMYADASGNLRATNTGPTTAWSYSGASTTTFTVPAGVYQITVYLWGAGGGASYCHADCGGGGTGGYVSGQIVVVPGEVLTVTSGAGGCGNCCSGGGGGGGGSAIYRGGSTMLAAAGGGGGGSYYHDYDAGKSGGWTLGTSINGTSGCNTNSLIPGGSNYIGYLVGNVISKGNNAVGDESSGGCCTHSPYGTEETAYSYGSNIGVGAEASDGGGGGSGMVVIFY